MGAATTLSTTSSSNVSPVGWPAVVNVGMSVGMDGTLANGRMVGHGVVVGCGSGDGVGDGGIGVGSLAWALLLSSRAIKFQLLTKPIMLSAANVILALPVNLGGLRLAGRWVVIVSSQNKDRFQLIPVVSQAAMTIG